MKKRGISPQIATVLLLGFVIAAIALIVLWSRGFTKEIQEKQGGFSTAKLSCSQDITINVIGVTGTTVKVENLGGKIDGVVIRVLEDGASNTQDVPISINSGEVKEVPYGSAGLVPTAVEVIPKINVAPGVTQPCSEQRVTYEF